jgi:uncharacterized membrane protein YdbT with pleckstrin-like domain
MFERIQFEPDEIIVTTVRTHWFVFVSRILGMLILLFLPLALFFVPRVITMPSMPTSAMAQSSITVDPAVLLLVGSLWALLLWVGIFRIWTDYYLDSWTVTNRRIIVIDQQGLFRRKVSSFRLERLQDIHVTVDGLIATFLDFGTIRAETAGHEEEAFVMRAAPAPQSIKAMILENADQLIRAERA